MQTNLINIHAFHTYILIYTIYIYLKNLSGYLLIYKYSDNCKVH